MTILEKYKDDFNELVDTVQLAYCNDPLVTSKPHLKALYESLVEERNQILLEREDIAQELSAMWCSFLKDFKKSKPKIHIRQYLIRLSVWGLRDWFKMQMKCIPYHMLTPKIEKDESSDHKFKIDLKFLLHGTDFYPLSLLSAYERYLIFLKFKEDRTILQIANAVQKTDRTIFKHFNKLIEKLRSQYNAISESS